MNPPKQIVSKVFASFVRLRTLAEALKDAVLVKGGFLIALLKIREPEMVIAYGLFRIPLCGLFVGLNGRIVLGGVFIHQSPNVVISDTSRCSSILFPNAMLSEVFEDGIVFRLSQFRN